MAQYHFVWAIACILVTGYQVPVAGEIQNTGFKFRVQVSGFFLLRTTLSPSERIHPETRSAFSVLRFAY